MNQNKSYTRLCDHSNHLTTRIQVHINTNRHITCVPHPLKNHTHLVPHSKVYTHAKGLIYSHLAMTYRGLASYMYCIGVVSDPSNICNCSFGTIPRTQNTHE